MRDCLRVTALAALSAMVLLVSSSAARRIPIPDDLFYYRPAASVFGLEAAWTNPAALGRYKTVSAQLLADYRDGAFGKSWGTVINRRGIAIAQRYIDNPGGSHFRETVFSSGNGLGKTIAVGGSYRYFSSGPGIYNNRHFWNLAVSGQGSGPFAWAAVFSNLNRGRVDGVRTETEQRYSLAYRPHGNTVTLAVDALLSTKQRFSTADFIYHAQISPARGMYFEGYIDSHQNFQIGFRANLLKYFVGSQGTYTSGVSQIRTTVYVGATADQQPSLISPRKRRLSMSVTGRPEENPTRLILGPTQTSFTELLLGVYRAAEDPSIGEMVLSLNRLGLGFAQAQELRSAVQYFRDRGKRVVCHVSSPNNLGYYVASAADTIVIPPVSQLNLVGLRAELTFYAGTLDKLGIKADLVQIGAYKRAAETYTRTSPSEESRAMTERLLDDLYDQFVTGIADGRGLTADSVRALIDQGPFTSAEALAGGLVDGLSYRDDLGRAGILPSMPEVTFRRYRADTLLNDGWPRLPQIAVVVAEGEITGNSGSVNPFDNSLNVTPSLMERAFRQVDHNRDVRGIVLRINSPGGLALAGEEIHHRALKTARSVPVVVSMSNVAASGGYYIATPAQRFFASPATVTGSIGIYGGKVDLSGLYEKVGLTKELHVRGRNAAMLSTARPFTDEERLKYHDQLEAFYRHFVELVAENRGLDVDSVDALARGQVWSGREALANGLVDRLGGLKDALDSTARTLDLNDYRVVVYPERRRWFRPPSVPFLGPIVSLFRSEGSATDALADAVGSLDDGDIYARLPFDLIIE